MMQLPCRTLEKVPGEIFLRRSLLCAATAGDLEADHSERERAGKPGRRFRHGGDFVISAELNRIIPSEPVEGDVRLSKQAREVGRCTGKEQAFGAAADDRSAIP